MAGERVERRLAAILAADVAGYSRLIGADEEGTLARLKALRRELVDPGIAARKGRIVKTTGDGLLVEFASVVDALRCAVEVQQAMGARNADIPPARRIEFRVGIHQGDIVVENGDIFGDGVNIAARLEGLAEPGGISVSARVQEDAAGKLAVSFEDLGELELKNIARAIRVYRVRSAGLLPDPPPADEGSASTPGGANITLALPDKPSIAVLPFANMSSDPEQEFFADGIAEDIITALSRYSSLFVIARNSCFTYKGRNVDVKQVARELGVRYVLEGSLRKSGNRIRVTAQLVEAATGNHLWAERYDRDLADIFAVQDEISQAVTIAIAPTIAGAEQQRAMRKPPESLDAWAAYQQGLRHLRINTGKDLVLAENFFQQSIELDPNFSGSYGWLALVYFAQANGYALRDMKEAQEQGEILARRGVALDPASGEALSCLAQALWARGDFAGAQAECQRALTLTPNLAMAHGVLGAVLISAGRPLQGIAEIEIYRRLDPRDPFMRGRANQIASGFYFARDYGRAVEVVSGIIREWPRFPLPYRWLAAALGQLGRIEEAKAALAKALALNPGALDQYARRRAPWFRPDDYDHMMEGLRKAGWEG